MRELAGSLLGAALIGCAPGPTPVAPLQELVDLTAAPGPNSALTLIVRWHTTAPATSVVRYGEGGTLTWEIADPALTTEHEVVLYGLHAEAQVTVRAASVFADGMLRVADDLVASTGALPPWVPVAEVPPFDEDRVQPGWTLINVSHRPEGWPPTAVMYDLHGEPVWYVVSAPGAVDLRGDLDTSFTADGRVLVGASGAGIAPAAFALSGERVWDGPPQVDPVQHHHFQQLDDGTYAALRYAADPGFPGLLLASVVQTDADNAVIWSWDAFDHLDALGVPTGVTGDPLHANSVTFDGDRVYLNSRNRSALYAIDRASSEVLWRLGSGGDFAPDPEAADPWFRLEHEPELQDDGSWLFYDNGGLLGDHARILQLAIDEEARTTEVVWQFPGGAAVDPWYTEDWYSPIWGDADRLPNGDVLVAAGTRLPGGQSRVFEVSPAGEVVWEMILPAEGEDVVGTYRAQRLDVPLTAVTGQ
ncbi:MAG: aryl-sulfate sulfotransferase [Myxococcota bacterium]